MVVSAIKALADKSGSSRQAINKYIVKEYKLTDSNHHSAMLKRALKRGSGADGPLVYKKGKGAAGSFKVKPAAAKPAKPAAKKAPAKESAPKAKPAKPAAAAAPAETPAAAAATPAKAPAPKKAAKPAKAKVAKEKSGKKSKAASPKKLKVVKAKKSPKKPAKKPASKKWALSSANCWQLQQITVEMLLFCLGFFIYVSKVRTNGTFNVNAWWVLTCIFIENGGTWVPIHIDVFL